MMATTCTPHRILVLVTTCRATEHTRNATTMLPSTHAERNRWCNAVPLPDLLFAWSFPDKLAGKANTSGNHGHGDSTKTNPDKESGATPWRRSRHRQATGGLRGRWGAHLLGGHQGILRGTARSMAVARAHQRRARPARRRAAAAAAGGSTGGHPEATLMRHAPLKLRCGTSCGAKCTTTLSHAHRRSCAIWHRHLHQAGSCAIWQLETTRCLKYHYMKADMRPAKLPELTGGLACRKTNGGGGKATMEPRAEGTSRRGREGTL